MYEGGQFSEQTAREIDVEVKRIIDEGVSDVRDLLQNRRAALDALAKRLVEKEVIDGSEVRAIIEAHYPGPKLVPGTLPLATTSKEDARDEERPLREGASPG
jgi:hypothetical protein